MSDEETTTPDTGNTVIDWESADNPYVERYREAQTHLTPLQQENARLKALEDDPQAYLEFGKTKGWVEFDEPTPPPQEDPLADLRQQTQELAAWKAEQEAEKQKAAQLQEFQNVLGAINTDLDAWSEEAGVTLSNATKRGMVEMLFEDPDAVNSDEKALRRIFDAEVKSLPRRQRPRVPHTPSSGGAETGVRTYDGMSRAEIDRDMAEQIRARSQH